MIIVLSLFFWQGQRRGKVGVDIVFTAITMKESAYPSGISYRLSVKASELPEWIYLKAKEMDEETGYLYDSREEQVFEVNGLVESDGRARALEVVYYWDDYEVIAELTEQYHSYIYRSFENFVGKYGGRVPDNDELMLGDCEYWDEIPKDIKDEWGVLEKV